MFHRIAWVWLALSAAAAALAQINTATVVGTVADPSGAVMAGATVTVTNTETGVVRKTVSNGSGAYEVPLLPVGTYSIAAEQKGFKRAEQTSVHLDAAQKAKIDLTLQVGDVADSVTVTAGASLLSTQTVERGQVINSNQVSNLPLNGRDIVQLISLQPGVVVGGQIKSTVTFNGLPYQGTTINIDGTDAANPDRPTVGNFSGQTRLNLLSQEFIEEFKTTQGVFSAEIGRAASGSVNVITKSGTNQLHGDLFEFVRNDKFDARNFFAARKDELRLNQFGATAGGAIVHDRLFFFGGWEASRERRGLQITGTVPTEQLRGRMVAANPAYGPLVNILPLPTEAIPGDPNRGIHRRSDVQRNREDVFNGRLDWDPGTHDHFFARYTIFDATVKAPNLSPVNSLTYPSQDRTFTFSWAHILSPRTLNEVRVGANKQDLPRTYAAFTPGGIGTLSGFLNTPSIEFLQANGGSATLDDTFSHNLGRHSLKAGFEVRRYHYGRANFQNPTYQMDTVDDILNSTPSSANVTLTVNEMTRLFTTETGIFVQDDFRVNRDLTLNLGLRWEYFSPVSERDGRLYNVADSPYGPFRAKGEPIWDSDHNNFAPRLGLAWDMFGSHKNVIRMGAGVFYAENMLRNVTILSQPPTRPNNVFLSRTDTPGLRYPLDPFALDPSKFTAPVSRLLVDPHHRTSYSEQWSFDYQRELTHDLFFTVGYAGNRGIKFLQVNFLNQVGANGLRTVPTIGQIRYETNDGSSVYHGLQTSLRKRYSHGLTFAAHYTYGKAITGGGGSEEGINDIQDPNNIRGSRSRTTLSLAHVASINYSWELPFAGFSWAKSGAGKALLQGWSLNGITSVRSGFPLNVVSGRDNFGSGNAGGQRPNYLGGDLRAGTDDFAETSLHNFINRAAVAPNGLHQYGNLGAWVLTGPGVATCDFSAFKTTAIRERVKLQFRAEFFNVLNRVNFSNPSTNLNAGTFGRITGAAAPRELQFGLKLIY